MCGGDIHIYIKQMKKRKIILGWYRVLHIYSLTVGDHAGPQQQDRSKSILRKIINNNQSIYWHPYSSY